MIDAEKARELAQAWVGLEASVELLDTPPQALYLARPGRQFYFAVRRPRVQRVGGDEIVIVDGTTGEVTISFAGE